jgi:O-antigen/teichoic acid export membrane protein
VPLAIGLAVLAPVLCVTVFGDEFRGAVDDLRVLAFGAFGIVALKLLGNALNAQGRPMLTNVGIGIAFTATVALDLLLIPSHGGLGAAIASTVAYTAGGVAIAFVFARALGRSPGELIPRGGEVRPLLRQLRGLLART